MRKTIAALLAVFIFAAVAACSTAEGDSVFGTNKDAFGIILDDAGYEEVNVQVDPDAETHYVATAKAGACTVTFRKEGDDDSDDYRIIKINDTTADLGPMSKDDLVTLFAQAEPPIRC